MNALTRLALTLVPALTLTGCVTTTTSPFEDTRDLGQAVETYIQIGYRHIENDNLFQAKESLREALEIDDRAAGAYLGLARVFDLEEDDELADEHFRRAIRYGGETEAEFQYGVFLYNERRYDDARDLFEEVTDDNFYERRAQAFEFLALTERRLENLDAAIRAYERAVVLDRMQVNSYLGLADLRYQQDLAGPALEAYNGYVSLVRAGRADYSPYSLWLGIRIAHRTGQSDLQSSLALQLRSRFPDSEEHRLYQSWREEEGAA